MPSPITLLTPELQDEICGLIEEGNRSEVAALACNIRRKTYEAWVTRGNKGIEPYAEFVEAIGSARARAEVEKLRISNEGDTKNGPDQAAGARFWMTRARSRHYAEEKRVTVELQTELDRFLDLLERVTDEDTYVRFLTAWKSENSRGAGNRPAVGEASGQALAGFLGSPDVVDTDGEPAS